jgi:hypothetical protein
MSAPAEHVRAFRCPECGNDGSRGSLRFLEDITCYRPILGVAEGVLEIDGRYRTEGYDDGVNMRFECRGLAPVDDGRHEECGDEWPVPGLLLACIDWI